MLPSTLDMVPSPSTLDKKIDSAPVMRTLERYLFFSLLKTIELSNYIMISFRTGPPTENYCLHSQVNYLQLSKKSFVLLKIWLAARRLVAQYVLSTTN